MPSTDLVPVGPFPATDPNPLLRIWHETVRSPHFSYRTRNMERSAAYRATRTLDFDAESERLMVRREVTCQYAFSVPTDEALDLIGSYRPIVEIGAGTGYWAALLRHRGVDVVAYDHKPAGHPDNWWYADARRFTHIDLGATYSLRDHGDRTLLMSWPPHNESLAERALDVYERAGGQRLIYIGTGYGECCATNAFFGRLGETTYDEANDWDGDEHPDALWREVARLDLPQWDDIDDALWVYERKDATF